MYAHAHNCLHDVNSLVYRLLNTIHSLFADCELEARSLADEERAILAGYDVWRGVRENRGGMMDVDLLKRRISFIGPSP